VKRPEYFWHLWTPQAPHVTMSRMTTPNERTRAVLETREFLQELLDSIATPGCPEEIRLQASKLLRHYPKETELRLANLALPQHFGPILTGRSKTMPGDT
jgi:hypothetical protein